MAANDPNNQNLPNFNRRDEDKMALGHTPSTRSAELVAGARAVLMNTPETTALGSMSGRIVARVLTETGGKSNILWFFPARMMAIETLTQRLLPTNKPDLLLVDVAAGFSPRGLHMAREYPQARVIEIDLPDVVAEKKLRLKRGRIPLPDNLSWIEADLGKVNLQDVLDGQQADLITSEGLTLYLSHEEIKRLFNQVSGCLIPGGVFIVETYFKEKLRILRQNPNVNTVASFVLRMVGNVPGMMPSVDTAVDYMATAGLTRMVEHSVADLMDELGQAKPVDVISIMVAHKPTAEEAAQAGAQPIFVRAHQSAEPEPLAADAPAARSAEAPSPEIKDSNKDHPAHPHPVDAPPPPGLD